MNAESKNSVLSVNVLIRKLGFQCLPRNIAQIWSFPLLLKDETSASVLRVFLFTVNTPPRLQMAGCRRVYTLEIDFKKSYKCTDESNGMCHGHP